MKHFVALFANPLELARGCFQRVGVIHSECGHPIIESEERPTNIRA